MATLEPEERRKREELMRLPARNYFGGHPPRRVMQTVAVCALIFCLVLMLLAGRCFLRLS